MAWDRDSKRHSLAQKYGSAGSKKTSISPMASYRSHLGKAKDEKFFDKREFKSFHLGLEVESEYLASGKGEIVGFGENPDGLETIFVRDSESLDIEELRTSECFFTKEFEVGDFVKDLGNGVTGEIKEQLGRYSFGVAWDGSPSNVLSEVGGDEIGKDLRGEAV